MEIKRVALPFIAALLLATPAIGQSVVQSNSAEYSSATTKTLAFNSGVVSGNVMVLLSASSNTQITTAITDTLNSTWTACPSPFPSSTSAGRLNCYYATVPSSGAESITVHFTNTGVQVLWAIVELGGVSAFDSGFQAEASGSSSTSLSVTSAASVGSATEVLLALGRGSAGTLTPTTGNGWTTIATSTGTSRSLIMYKASSSFSGTQTATMTAASAGFWDEAIIGFKSLTPSAPTISPAAGTYFLQQSLTLSCSASSPTIYYTTDGSTPTHSSTVYSGAFNSASSGSQTIKTICESGGYDSAVASFDYSIAPTDTQLFSDDGSTYYHPGLGADHVPQLPLDQWTTGGVWKMNGTISGVLADSSNSLTKYISVISSADCTPHSSGYCFGLKTPGPGGSTQSFVTYTGSTIGADQFAKDYITPITSSGKGGVGVGCATDGSLTGYTLLAEVATGHAILRKVVSGTPTTLSDVSGLTIVAHTSVELRRINSGTASQSLQALIGGTSIAVVSDTAITGGQPCIALGNSTLNGVSDFTAGGVGNSTYSANSYSPSHSTLDDAANTSGWTPAWPLYHSIDGGQWAGLLTSHVYNSTLYGVGISSAATQTQYEYRRPTGLNQFIEFKPTINPWDTTLNNMFALLHHETWIPGFADGGCTAAGTSSVCFDELSDYIGTEYMANNRANLGLTGCTSGSTAKNEYCGTPFLHFTKVTGTPSSTNSNDPNYCAGGSVLAHGCNNVITGAGSFYTPTLALGDTVRIEAVGNHVRAYCKGGSSPASRQSSHAYSLNDLIQDSNGNLQRVLTAGTSASSGPSSWASNWGLASAFNGDHTTDGGVTWEYFGKACPTVGSWSMVFDAVENDNASVPGFTGLWQGGAPAAAFTAISTGTVTDAGLCATLPEGCGGQQPPILLW